MGIVFFDVVENSESDEFYVYTRSADDAALLAAFSTKAGATAFALYLCKTPANYGRHPDGADGFSPPIPFA